MDESSTSPGLSTWLRLVRFPNLLTVPGDPLAGAVLCAVATGTPLTAWRPAAAATVSLLLYAAGLIDNDIADHAEDLDAERPRPLVTGAIRLGQAARAEAVLVCLGLLLALALSVATFLVFLTLQGCVWLYNRRAKRHPRLGPLVMGACRGLSVLAGAVAFADTPAVRAPLVLAGATGSMVYIAAVTSIARDELSAGVSPGHRWLPGLAVAALVLSVGYLARSPGPLWYGAAGIAIAGPWLTGRRLAADSAPPDIQRAIGGWIRGLLLIQAMCCALYTGAGQILMCALLLLVPVNARLAKRFYAT